jgi:hypothetical protein
MLLKIYDSQVVHYLHNIDLVAALNNLYILFFFEFSVKLLVSIIFIEYLSPLLFSTLLYTMEKLPVPNLSNILYNFCTETPLKVLRVSAHSYCSDFLEKYNILVG